MEPGTRPPLIDRLEPIWLWVEPLSALLVALVLYFPLQRPDLAELTGIFGVLLTVTSVATTTRLQRELDTVRKLSDVVDLSRMCNVQSINELLRLYLNVGAPELSPIKEDAVRDCITVLSKLAFDKMSPEATSSEYYTWLLGVLATAGRGSRIRAVSVMDEAGWTEIPTETRFLEANIEAAKRGVHIERIFLTTRERLRDPGNRAVIARHIENQKEGLIAHIVWRDELAVRDPSLLLDAGEGFIAFDERVALLDTAVPPSEAKGVFTMNETQLKQMGRVFGKLKLHSVMATEELMRTCAQA